MSTQRQQQGFTMIELIVVIVILGVLAAVALPRLTNMQRDARVAVLNGARGSVAAASAMVHGAAMARQGQVQPVCAPAGIAPVTIGAANGNGQICTESGLTTVTSLYPAGTLQGIVLAAGIAQINSTPAVPLPANADINTALRTAGFAANVNAGVVRISVLGGPNAANCSFTYTRAPGIGQAPVIGDIVTDGC